MFAFRSWLVSGVLALALLVPAARAQETLTYAKLVERMTDLARLAALPEPGENCGQCSSYDRASKYDAKTGKYVNWDANGDGDGIIRREGDRVVMAEMKGPGCIWRIWSAAAGQGHVKIYLDNQAEPTLDLPFIGYFDGKHPPLAYPALSYDMTKTGSAGQNLYLPIPYQKSCKVVAEKNWGAYYHFTYATYPAGTVLPTFSAELAARHAKELQAVNDFFAGRLGTDPAGPRPGEATVSRAVQVAAGQTVAVARIDGPRAITGLWVKAKFADRADQMAALRRLALRITWDGQPQPAVWCPLGDFFGTAPGVNLYKTLMTGMTKEGFYSYWYMPFAKSAVVELLSDDQQDRQLGFEITHAPLDGKRGQSPFAGTARRVLRTNGDCPLFPMEGLGYFHTKWHRDTVEVPHDRWPDWIMLETQGRGRFCGVMLHVWSPRGDWWGEGDEKFFVDGEKFPSTFGTGSEDYFGYAWCCPQLFQRPYHAQTMTEMNRGHQSVLRWHVVDNVPFQKSFQGCIEKYFKNDHPTLYACTARWYLAAGGADPYDSLPIGRREGYFVKPQPVYAGIRVLGTPKGQQESQGMEPFGAGRWKNNQQLWWTGARPKDKLVLAVPVAKGGKYEVLVNLTKARDYGIVRLALDDRKPGEPIDLYNPTVVPSGPISLGTCELAVGQHKLVVEIVGANPAAEKAYMFGIDRIELKEIRD